MLCISCPCVCLLGLFTISFAKDGRLSSPISDSDQPILPLIPFKLAASTRVTRTKRHPASGHLSLTSVGDVAVFSFPADLTSAGRAVTRVVQTKTVPTRRGTLHLERKAQQSVETKSCYYVLDIAIVTMGNMACHTLPDSW